MAAEQTDYFQILGFDNVLYGPVELPVLVAWMQEERIRPSTWIYSQSRDEWLKASAVPELTMFFTDTSRSRVPTGYDTELSARVPDLKPGALRRIKVFATLSDEQLTRFLTFLELKEVKQFASVVRQDDPGDSMYFLLQGEVRVRVMIAGKETLLAVLATGDFFGEISLFDQGARSADVVANEDSVLLRLTAGTFHKMVGEASDLAAPFLHAMGKTLTTRIRAGNKRYAETVAYARLGASPVDV